MRRIANLIMILVLGVIIAPVQVRPGSASSKETQGWVKRSNENAQVLLSVVAKFSPEGAGQLGVDGLDEEIFDLRPGLFERTQEALTGVLTDLKAKLAAENDPSVQQDLQILIKSASDNLRSNEISERLQVPYFNIARTVFGGLRGLLDDQVSAARRPAALVRLRKYAGMEKGYTPITTLAENYTRERMNKPNLKNPVKAEVQKDLAQNAFFVEGIGKLFAKYGIQGYEEAYDTLKGQLKQYEEFVRTEILPIADDDFRLPAELYAFSIEQVGVDIPAAELAVLAHAAFNDIQQQMQKLASRVVREKGITAIDYRDVIRALKKDQLVGDAILPFYESRIHEIEEIIKRERLVTLPDRPMRIRLASEAESAQIPAPNMRPPRLLGNTGEMGEFVLPLNIPSSTAGKTQKFDDFSFAAASWTLTAHEGRPGHEMQFASMVEKGVSTTRAIFAFNSVNVEGWGLYSEAIMLPFMPLDGQLISLQARLIRAARAFLDPELQTGKITREEALSILKNDVVLSDAMANQEVERYTFYAPGQATSYFYGYTKLMDLRNDVEKELGARFDQQKFHDLILAQGLLPPDLMRKAVMSGLGIAN